MINAGQPQCRLFAQTSGNKDELLQGEPTTGQWLQNEAGPEQQVVPVEKQKESIGHRPPPTVRPRAARQADRHEKRRWPAA
jgi:hypothetical protein